MAGLLALHGGKASAQELTARTASVVEAEVHSQMVFEVVDETTGKVSVDISGVLLIRIGTGPFVPLGVKVWA